MRKRFLSHSVEQTYLIAEKEIAPCLKKGDILVLDGDLGAGKTTFARGFVKHFGIDPEHVSSPTFTLMNVYKGDEVTVLHVDFYRILESDDIFFEEFSEMQEDAVSLVEWGKKFIDELAENSAGKVYLLTFKVKGETERELVFEKYTDS